MDKPYIKIQNISKTIDKKTIISNCNYTFQKGKVHGIIGRNGSGKSMLLKMICGLIKPSTGKIFVDEKQIGIDCDFAPNMSCIIETPGFLENETAYKNLLFLYRLTHKSSKNDKPHIFSILKKVGLSGNEKKKVKCFSTGMKQRLGLAQVLMEDSNFLILDEPMNGLDESGVSDIRNIILELKNQQKTILLTSHIPEDINTLCDTISTMQNKTINSQQTHSKIPH